MLASEIVKPARVLAKDPEPGTYSDAAYLGQARPRLPRHSRQDQVSVRAHFDGDDRRSARSTFCPRLRSTTAPARCGSTDNFFLEDDAFGDLQGQPIGYNHDQSGFGTQSPGSAGPTANAGSYVPQWTVQPPTSFPLANYQGLRTFNAPWSQGGAPKYVFHGGNILIIPAPNANAPLDTEQNPIPNLVIDMAMTTAYLGPTVWNANTVQPQCLTAIGQRIWFPSNFKNALVWGLVERIRGADDTGSSKESRNDAGQNFRDQINELYFWARSYPRTTESTCKPTVAGISVGGAGTRSTEAGIREARFNRFGCGHGASRVRRGRASWNSRAGRCAAS